VADANILTDNAFSWRFRVGPDLWGFQDLFRGTTEVDPSVAGGDFVVWKSAKTPAYQLAVVVDDAAQGITEVIRGDDLIPSTPRQLQLYQALGLQPPTFAHVPLVVGPEGRRLAKRHGDTRLATLRRSGVKAEMLLGLLAWSCGWRENIAAASLSDLLPSFRLETIQPRPFVLQAVHLQTIGYTF
jgi:glutamyl-tRNA synthetase